MNSKGLTCTYNSTVQRNRILSVQWLGTERIQSRETIYKIVKKLEWKDSILIFIAYSNHNLFWFDQIPPFGQIPPDSTIQSNSTRFHHSVKNSTRFHHSVKFHQIPPFIQKFHQVPSFSRFLEIPPDSTIQSIPLKYIISTRFHHILLDSTRFHQIPPFSRTLKEILISFAIYQITRI